MSASGLFFRQNKEIYRSVLDSETMALADAFDTSFVIQRDHQSNSRNTIPNVILTV